MNYRAIMITLMELHAKTSWRHHETSQWNKKLNMEYLIDK